MDEDYKIKVIVDICALLLWAIILLVIYKYAGFESSCIYSFSSIVWYLYRITTKLD